MERGAWTEARLDDRFDQIDRRFDQMDRRFDRLEDEMKGGFASLRTEFDALRITLIRVGGGLTVALVAAILVRGA